MNLSKAINKAKKDLKEKAKKEYNDENAVWENYGQDKVSELKDNYIDISDYSPEMNAKRAMIEEFYNYCINYTGK